MAGVYRVYWGLAWRDTFATVGLWGALTLLNITVGFLTYGWVNMLIVAADPTFWIMRFIFPWYAVLGMTYAAWLHEAVLFVAIGNVYLLVSVLAHATGVQDALFRASIVFPLLRERNPATTHAEVHRRLRAARVSPP